MKALILVDIQNDFLPGGALAVARGDEILSVVNDLLKKPFDLIIATKDWHPLDHGSFASNHGKEPGEHITLEGLDQILWPVHCVQETWGSEFAPGWDTKKINKIIYKGTDTNIDSYSTFYDNGHRRSTGLDKYLTDNKIREVYIAGLATDYCVKYSVLDALAHGFDIFVFKDACRGVNLNPDDSQKALDVMKKAGAHLIESTYT